MDTIEKIKKCIEDTEIRNASKYDIKGTEIIDILKSKEPLGGVVLAFCYGRAMGYRAAKENAWTHIFRRSHNAKRG